MTEVDTLAGERTADTVCRLSTRRSNRTETTIVSVGDVTVTEGGAATFTVTMTGATHETGFDVRLRSAWFQHRHRHRRRGG